MTIVGRASPIGELVSLRQIRITAAIDGQPAGGSPSPVPGATATNDTQAGA